MYAAIKYHHPHAKLLYSEYCRYAPQTRYFDYDHVKRQMYKVHRPHIESGHIKKVFFEELRNDDGSLDCDAGRGVQEYILRLLDKAE